MSLNPSLISDTERSEVFGELFKKFWPSLFTHARKKLNDEGLAKDIVQETFAVLWKSDILSRPDEIKPYLFSVLRHKILDEFRRDEVRLRHANDLANHTKRYYLSADSDILTKELKHIIDAEIEKMPHRMSEIFNLNKIQKQSISEIATSLELSEQTVKNQIYRATERLRKRLVSYDSTLLPMIIILYAIGNMEN